jgi:hypothetical protein
LLYRDEETLEKFLGSLDAHDGTAPLLGPIVTEIAETIKGCVRSAEELSTVEDYRKYYDEDEGEEIDALKKGWKVLVGCFSDDDGDDVESMLCNLDFSAEGDGWKFSHSGGY